MIRELEKSNWLTWLPCNLLLETESQRKEPGMEREKAHEFLEKIPKTQLDKLPEVTRFYRLQVFARDKRNNTILLSLLTYLYSGAK